MKKQVNSVNKTSQSLSSSCVNSRQNSLTFPSTSAISSFKSSQSKSSSDEELVNSCKNNSIDLTVPKSIVLSNSNNNNCKKTSVDKIGISSINVQGLTRAKAYELENLLGDHDEANLLCISETHLTYKKIDFSSDIKFIHQMRKEVSSKLLMVERPGIMYFSLTTKRVLLMNRHGKKCVNHAVEIKICDVFKEENVMFFKVY